MAWLWTLALGVISLVLVVGAVVVSRQSPEPPASAERPGPERVRSPAHDNTSRHASSGHEGSPSFWVPMGPAFEWTHDDDRQLMELLQQGARDSDPKKRAPFGFEGTLGDHAPGDRHRPDR